MPTKCADFDNILAYFLHICEHRGDIRSYWVSGNNIRI